MRLAIVLIRSGKEFVAAVFARQLAIHQLELRLGAETDVVETLVAVAQDPRLAAHEDVLQPFADHAVKLADVVGRDALAVGRVGDEDGGLRCAHELLEGHGAERDVTREAGAAHVALGAADGVGRDVGAVTEEFEIALPRVVVVDRLKKLAVKVWPALEGEALAIDAGRDVEGDHGGFDEQGAGATHGVDEVRLAAPSGEEDHAGGQDLVQRCLALLHAVSAPVQTLARTVEGQRAIVVRDVDMDGHVRVAQAHGGALAGALLEAVGYGVLRAVSHELGVAEILGIDDRVHGEGAFGREVSLPLDGLDGLVDLVRVFGTKAGYGLEDAQGGSTVEVGLVKHGLIATKGHHASARLDGLGTERAKLVGQHILQSVERFGY